MIQIFDFRCEITCKIISDIKGDPIHFYKNLIYFVDIYNNELYTLSTNNYKIKKYSIDLVNYIKDIRFEPNLLIIISNDKILFGNKTIIEYKLNKNKQFLKNKTYSPNNSTYFGCLSKGKNGDIIYFGNKILFFSNQELLKD